MSAGAALAGALPASPALAHGQGKGPADLIVHNGRVVVMDRRMRIAQAVAIRDGVVIGVGNDRDMLKLSGRRTQSIDAGGGTVLPGINDSHVHLNGLGFDLPPFNINVDTATIEELVGLVAAAAAGATSPDSWIRGGGWNENRLPRAPRRTDLDPVSGDHPVILRDFSAHMIVVNSKVLQLAGITRDTVPPPGGVIEKDEAGEPTGVLRESAQGLVQAIVPPFTPEETENAIKTGIQLLHAQGITSMTDPGIGYSQLDLYRRMSFEGTLAMRMTVLITGGRSPQEVRDTLAAFQQLRGVDPRRLRVAGCKLIIDGVPTAAQTAWLHEPYVDGRNGAPVIAGATLEEAVANIHAMIKLVHDAGLQVGTHATGDAGIDAVVSAYLAAMRGNRRFHDPRHYVIHGDLTPVGTLRTMARNGIGANMNATIKYLLGRTLDANLGPERTDYQWPYRTALDLGVKVTSASDAPVTPPSWRQGVQSAVLREGRFGGVAGEAERISVEEALVTYTRTAAWQDRAERWKGTLEVGMAGDVCVVAGDVLDGDPHTIVDMPIAATVLGGTVVYDGTSSDATVVKAMTPAAIERRNAYGAACLKAGLCCCQRH
ncbi:amidohydrolase [Acrocarpospora pleiomorpha]|uniref:Amidohydrolase n=1 Tax=Acrocarpospora pleiomorpha TaxID=90975 RepID=A0A5M3XTZ7_9ACTN|nr:amidohydrolase [Acrocarpospora pleiomorpha]